MTIINFQDSLDIVPFYDELALGYLDNDTGNPDIVENIVLLRLEDPPEYQKEGDICLKNRS